MKLGEQRNWGSLLLRGALSLGVGVYTVFGYASENGRSRLARVSGSEHEILTVTIENDAISNQDRHYTSGIRVSKLLRGSQELLWLRNVSDALTGRREVEGARYELAIGQQLYTPADLKAKGTVLGDRPYAGWLYGSAGMLTRKGKFIDQFELSVGMVGPAALGEETQDLVHRLIGSTVPLGWDNQIRNEPTVQVFAQRNWWAVHGAEWAGLRWDVVPHVGAAMGNVFMYGNGGVTVSMGRGAEESYGFPRLGYSLPGRGYFNADNGFSWQVFGSAVANVVGRNLFLDGNTFGGLDTTVEKERVVGELQVGVQFVWGRNRVSFVQVGRTREFDTQEDSELYGALSFSRAY